MHAIRQHEFGPAERLIYEAGTPTFESGSLSGQNIALLRELYGAWGRGDFATGYAFDPEVEFVRIGAADLDGAWRGIDGMWSAVVEWLRSWQLIRLEAEEFVECGDRVLVLTRQSGRGKHSGVLLDRELGDLFTFRNGKIVRLESYWNRDEAVRAAGLEPP
jgi:ketosteroid isomerase-like protein